MTGRTVTIAKSRAEVFAFIRDLSNASAWMGNVAPAGKADGATMHWTISAPAGVAIDVAARISSEHPDTRIAWTTTSDSQVEGQGEILLRDAPGDRGTEVSAVVAYMPPLGEIGRLMAKLLQVDPHIQGRHALKRLRMLMETGEIATSQNRKQESH